MRICIFGDSITWGAYDAEKGGWVNRLKSHFIKNGDEIEVYNLGICGNTSADLLIRIEVEAITRKPELMVFAIGINDVNFIEAATSSRNYDDDFRDNLAKLYEIAGRFTAKIIFVGLTSVDEAKTLQEEWYKAYSNENIKRLDQIIKAFCSEMNLNYVFMQDLLNKDDLIDGGHPNARGHQKMFERLRPIIEAAAK